MTADAILHLSRCRRGSLIKIRGLTRTLDFMIRTSLVARQGDRSDVATR